MATEYIVSKNRENKYGLIGLSTNVFELIAENCLEEIGDVKVAARSGLKKSITCKVVNSYIVISMNVLINRNGININDISARIQRKVHDSIVQLTEFKDVIVNVNVVGFYYR